MAAKAVRLIVATADTKTINQKKGISSKYLFLSDIVEHGDEGKMVKKREATKDEYVLGLKYLETQRGFTSRAVNALLRHQEMVVQDNCTLACVTICRYSEIFTRVVDGRLP